MILVEGPSDRAALATLAGRRGRDLAAERVGILSIGGATNIGHALATVGPSGLNLRLAGLCDAGEEADFRQGLESVGMGRAITRTDMVALGFHVCESDLEEELIRALGWSTVEQIVEAQGELGSFRTFQKQPAQRERTIDQQLRRFMGTRSGRKVRYGRLLVEALDLRLVPQPLDLVLSHV